MKRSVEGSQQSSIKKFEMSQVIDFMKQGVSHPNTMLTNKLDNAAVTGFEIKSRVLFV